MEVDIVVGFDESDISAVRRDDSVTYGLVGQWFTRVLLRIYNHVVRQERTAVDLLFVGIIQPVTLIRQIAENAVLLIRGKRLGIIYSIQDVIHHIRTRSC